MVTSPVKRVLITGSGRGLGLALAEHYLTNGWQVIGTCRQSTPALQRLAEDPNLTIDSLDIDDEENIERFGQRWRSTPIDVVINNAGVHGTIAVSLDELDPDVFMQAFRTNALGALLVTKALADSVAHSERRIVVNISSRLGSIEENDWGDWYAYGSSKSALNRITVSLAQVLSGRGITVVALHPGWVSTDMGGPDGPLTPAQSAQSIARTVDALEPEKTGGFYDYEGRSFRW